MRCYLETDLSTGRLLHPTMSLAIKSLLAKNPFRYRGSVVALQRSQRVLASANYLFPNKLNQFNGSDIFLFTPHSVQHLYFDYCVHYLQMARLLILAVSLS